MEKGWIDAKDLIPTDKEDVLVFVDNGKTNYYGVYLYNPDVWDMIGVTHWMPLPKSPKNAP